MIDHAHLMRSAMRNKDMLVIASDTPDTGSTTIRLVHQYRPNEFLLRHIDHAESTRVHPSLLQLRCRDGETPQVVGYIYIFAVGSYTDSPKALLPFANWMSFTFVKPSISMTDTQAAT